MATLTTASELLLGPGVTVGLSHEPGRRTRHRAVGAVDGDRRQQARRSAAAMAIGIVIALLQALTQVQEVTLTFIPKIIAILVVRL